MAYPTTDVTEVAPDLFRICTWVPEVDLHRRVRMNQWLELAPRAEPVCSFVSANVNLSDFATRPARVLGPDERLETGGHRFRYLPTPQVPHAWDAGLLFEETRRTLFCSDLFHQNGNVEAMTTEDIVGRFQQTLRQYEQSPFAGYVPWTQRSRRILEGLAELAPRTLLPMHGSVCEGDGRGRILDLVAMLEEELGGEA